MRLLAASKSFQIERKELSRCFDTLYIQSLEA